jgi:putative ABC transport system permease protein
MTEQRVKEVGIRKVLGSSISGIMILFSKEFTKWVIISNILAWPIAWIAMNKWLQSFAFKIEQSLLVFLFAGILALFIALLTVGSQALKAAIANPANSLRYE